MNLPPQPPLFKKLFQSLSLYGTLCLAQEASTCLMVEEIEHVEGSGGGGNVSTI